MVRPSSPLLLICTLLLGILLGLNLDQGRDSSRPRRGRRLRWPRRARTSGRLRPRPRRGSEATARTSFTTSSPGSTSSSSTSTGRSRWSPRRSRRRSSTSSPRRRAGIDESHAGPALRGDRLGRDRPGRRAAGLYVLTNNHVVEGAAPAKISIFLQRRPVDPPRPDLARRQGRHRRAEPRPRRPARRPARQQRRRDRRELGAGPGQPVRPDPLGQPGDHQRPRPAHGRAARTSRTRTSSRPTPRSTRATRAGRW